MTRRRPRRADPAPPARRRRRLGLTPLALLALAGWVAAGCSDPPTSGGDAARTGDADGDGAVDLPDCPLDALDQAGGPVEVDLWYGGLNGSSKIAMDDMAAAFNASQDAVVVNASNQGAAYMSGVNVNLAKIAAYVMSGVFAAIAGLFLTAQTLSGDATKGGVFTLQSIAVVVLGGTSLFGGSGGVAGTIAGAFALPVIRSILFFGRIDPLQQPLWEGVVILLAVAAGATRIITVKNRMDILR